MEKTPPLSVISHDLKTPLAGIQMMLHLLQEQKAGALNEKQLFMVDQAINDSDRLLEIIQKYCEDHSDV